MSKARHFEMLEFIRGLAAIYVLISHSLWLYFFSEYQDLHHLFHPFKTENLIYVLFYFRNQAVIVFFVISGYSVTHSYYTSVSKESSIKQAVKKFYLRRFFRIYPTYIISVILTLVLFYFTKQFFNQNELLTPASSRIIDTNPPLFLDFLKSVFYLKVIPFNYSLWSLRPEFYFYLLLPVLLYLSKKYWIAPLMLFIILFLWNIEAIILFNFFIYFMFGILVYYFKNKLMNIPFSVLFIFPLLALVVMIAADAFNGGKWSLQGLNIASGLFTSALVVITLKYQMPQLHPLIQLPGKSSYSLYLFHFPLLYFFFTIEILPYFVCLLLTIGLSILFYYLFERPMVQIKFKYK